MSNEILKCLCERRSIRTYKNNQITDEELFAVIKAGQYAPTGKNRMPVKFVAIQDKAMLERLSRWNADIMGASIDPFYGAPTAILVLADSSVPTYVEDGSLALGILMNAAHSLGLGSCWINRARQMFSSAEGKTLLAEWNIPQSFEGIGFCILGYPDCTLPAPSPRPEDQVILIR